MQFNNEVEAVDALHQTFNKIKSEIGKVVIGQDEIIKSVLIAIFSNGHCLLVGVPGLAKTLLVQTVANVLDLNANRIQFTPDLMPSDVLGTPIFNTKTGDFEFRKGPIFGNIVLVDEINRAPAKTQSALFEVMEERQVTIDGETYIMDEPFMVLATQNPIEQEGTYRLPEAQLDRFLFKIEIKYPTVEEEIAIITAQHTVINKSLLNEVKPVLSIQQIKDTRTIIRGLYVEPKLIEFIAQIVFETRHNPSLYLGASPRASLAIIHSAKALAAIQGRDFVTPDDIITVAVPVLTHRILLSPEKEMEGLTTTDIINQIIKKIEIPR